LIESKYLDPIKLFNFFGKFFKLLKENKD